MKDWEQVYEGRRKRNWAWLQAGVSLALLGWVLYFLIMPLLRQP
jgi:hypothetical protein